ncbi:hypothetical protein ACS0TY_036680 [Phlomoides rotata]
MFLDFAVVVDGEDVAKFTDAVKNLSLSKIIVEVEKQGSSFSELFAVPEQDDWVYADWKSASRVAFVFELYKAGGLFGELASSIQVTVFTGKNVLPGMRGQREMRTKRYIPQVKCPPSCLETKYVRRLRRKLKMVGVVLEIGVKLRFCTDECYLCTDDEYICTDECYLCTDEGYLFW